VSLGVLVAALCGCSSLDSSFVCRADRECVIAGVQGFCEQTGSCSFADASCASGRRYGAYSLAGLAGQCTGMTDSGCGAPNQPCCGQTPACQDGLRCRDGLCSGCVIHLAAGGAHTCALLDDGRVMCWGSNGSRQLGNEGSSPNPVPSLVMVGTEPLVSVAAIAAGSVHTCALDGSGRVLCWGANDQGELGTGSRGGPQPVPTVVGGMPRVRQVVTLDLHSCARTTGGLYCWGYGDYGQLGDGTAMTSAIPLLVAPPSAPPWSAVATGYVHTCALDMVGSVYCWGRNDQEQLGQMGIDSSPRPLAVGFAGAVAVGAGSVHSCALRNDHSVWCWGAGGSGRLGNGTTVTSAVPVQAIAPGQALALTVGGAFSCALTVEPFGHGVRCWGANVAGQLGTGDNRDQPTPVPVNGLSADGVGVAEVVAGDSHTCALREDGRLLCWGRDNSGQLADPSYLNSALPRSVPLACPE
jgi:alpha-tubulin suppressor-like RCC1 family protein